MKKIFALLTALIMAACALSLTAFAKDIVVFDNPDGESFADCANPWDFFGVGGFWGRQAATVLDITIDDLKAILNEGGGTFTFVFTGDAPSQAPNMAFEFGDGEVTSPCEYKLRDDGKYEATGSLDDLVKVWTKLAGRTIDEVANFLIQPWSGNFVLYSAKFTTTADVSEAPAEPEAPAEETSTEEAPAEEAPASADEEPAETGIVLCLLPMAAAAAALAVTKKR